MEIKIIFETYIITDLTFKQKVLHHIITSNSQVSHGFRETLRETHRRQPFSILTISRIAEFLVETTETKGSVGIKNMERLQDVGIANLLTHFTNLSQSCANLARGPT